MNKCKNAIMMQGTGSDAGGGGVSPLYLYSPHDTQSVIMGVL